MAKRPTSRSSFDPDAIGDSPIPQGKNYLLTIGIDEYEHCAKLNNAVGDARDLVRLLQKKYQFETQRSFTCYNGDATWEGIDQAFDYCSEKIEAPDNLVIYFSGHGHYEPKTEGAYWIPADARYQRVQDYYSYDRVTRRLKSINSQHTFLIVDSCYSGAVLIRSVRSGINRLERDPSRWILASGRNEVVPDGEIGGHSPFASQLLDVLNRYAGDHLPVMELVTKVTTAVVHNARQTPIGCPLRDVGDKGGQFVFHPRDRKVEPEWPKLKGNIEACRDYIETFPKGKLLEQAYWEIATLTDSESGYKLFIRQFPAGDNSRIARSKIKLLGEQSDHHSARFDIRKLILYLAIAITLSTGIFVGRKTYLGWKYPLVEPEMVRVAGGTFIMGSPLTDTLRDDDEKQYLAKVSDFEIGKYEVTQALWSAVMEGDNPSSLPICDECPVQNVSWEDTQTFLKKLNLRLPGKNYRLPTEAEWEFAARGGNAAEDTSYANLNNLDAIAWYFANAGGMPHQVGLKSQTSLGLFDMIGNVWEWCQDLKTAYPDSMSINYGRPKEIDVPRSYEAVTERSLRGASWDQTRELADLRIANRASDSPSHKSASVGFRLARTSTDSLAEMVFIRGGSFIRSNTENPTKITLSDFVIGTHEVTFAEFDAFCKEQRKRTYPSDATWGRGSMPVINVSWFDAIAYCNWLSKKAGYKSVYKINRINPEDEKTWEAEIKLNTNGYRLPTEAEWEYAAHGGNDKSVYVFAGSNDAKTVSWYIDNSLGRTHPVKTKEPNLLGLYDMSGNVWEWCQDHFIDSPNSSKNNLKRTIKGGCWGDPLPKLHIEHTEYYTPDHKRDFFGFRVARTP